MDRAARQLINNTSKATVNDARYKVKVKVIIKVNIKLKLKLK